MARIGPSKASFNKFRADVQDEIGHAPLAAQRGGKHASAKLLSGFGGAAVLEIAENHDGDTYRAVYTVRFPDALDVRHAFQKKSKSGKKPRRTKLT